MNSMILSFRSFQILFSPVFPWVNPREWRNRCISKASILSWGPSSETKKAPHPPRAKPQTPRRQHRSRMFDAEGIGNLTQRTFHSWWSSGVNCMFSADAFATSRFDTWAYTTFLLLPKCDIRNLNGWVWKVLFVWEVQFGVFVLAQLALFAQPYWCSWCFLINYSR